MSESAAEVAYRLQNETECRRIADIIKRELSPGLGFVLFTATHGDGGAFSNCSYVSTIERDDAARLLTEMLDHWADDGRQAEPNVRTATVMREGVAAMQDVPWQRLLHGARCSVRDAESALTRKDSHRAQVEVLKAATELVGIFSQLRRAEVGS